MGSRVHLENGPNGVSEPIALGKYDMVPRGIPGGSLYEEKELLEGDAPSDLAKVHGHKNMIRAMSTLSASAVLRKITTLSRASGGSHLQNLLSFAPAR